MNGENKKVKIASRPKLPIVIFMVAFALIGAAVLLRTRAASGLCSTSGVLGTVSYTANIPETGQYKLWVRMQVPDTTNTGNVNGVRVELDGAVDQCFTVTSTAQNAVNQWQWVDRSAAASGTQHVTDQLTSGSYTVKLQGLKAGVKVDKIILVRSTSTCVPSNDFTNGSPGDNCTTAAPTVTINANPTSVVSGNSTVLTWSSTNASSCTASGAWSGAKNASGTQTISNLTSNSTFTLTCQNVGGTVSASAPVTVTQAPPPTDTTPPAIDMTITGVTVPNGATSVTVNDQKVLDWHPSASDASGIKSISYTVNGTSVPLTNGAIQVGATANGNYTLSVAATDNRDNNANKSLTVRLRHPDFDRNGVVGFSDLARILANWQVSNNQYDIDNSGQVNFADLAFVLSRWNSTQ